MGTVVYFVFFKRPIESPPVSEEKTLEEKLQDVTALTVGKTPGVSEEIIKSLTVPSGGEELSEDILKSLTVL